MASIKVCRITPKNITLIIGKIGNMTKINYASTCTIIIIMIST